MRGSPTPGCAVSERHDPSMASRPTGCPVGWRRPTPRSRFSGSIWRWRPSCEGADLVHSHTWYANFAGHVAKMLYGTPHVVTTHSLEPLRPWKAEQLGGGYTLSSWAERGALASADAIIAVSEGMRRDVLANYPEISSEKFR
ncbi:glycosyltransferase [Streptosporangium lutulentum]